MVGEARRPFFTWQAAGSVMQGSACPPALSDAANLHQLRSPGTLMTGPEGGRWDGGVPGGSRRLELGSPSPWRAGWTEKNNSAS